MVIPEYNTINVLHDDKIVIQAKINTLKKYLEEGKITEDDYMQEKLRVENAIIKHKLGYAFTW